MMTFFDGGSRFHTVKRSGSPDPAENGQPESKLLSMLDDIDELDESKAAVEDVKPVKPEASPSSPAAGKKDRKEPHKTTDGEQHAIMAMAMAGKKASEIAAILGLRSNTVYKLIQRKQKQALSMITLEEHDKMSPGPKSKSRRAKK